jgi:hypothetical protein
VHAAQAIVVPVITHTFVSCPGLDIGLRCLVTDYYFVALLLQVGNPTNLGEKTHRPCSHERAANTAEKQLLLLIGLVHTIMTLFEWLRCLEDSSTIGEGTGLEDTKCFSFLVFLSRILFLSILYADITCRSLCYHIN